MSNASLHGYLKGYVQNRYFINNENKYFIEYENLYQYCESKFVKEICAIYNKSLACLSVNTNNNLLGE